MTEMAACDWGQCAISNQPSFHIPFIYTYLGQPEKTEYWLKKICAEGFSWKDDGFPGDEDNGTMAAWYIFATLGFYPTCPGKPEFTVSGPIVKSAILHTPNGKVCITKKLKNKTKVNYFDLTKA
jgi:putative alpha-1,2-mannosidase